MSNRFFKPANYDIIYFLLTLIVFLLDILTNNKFLDTLTLIMILIGFAIIIINAVIHTKIESLRQINYLAGYLSFILIVVFLAVFSFLDAYTSISLVLSDILRYITTIMLLIYNILFAVMKRSMK